MRRVRKRERAREGERERGREISARKYLCVWGGEQGGCVWGAGKDEIAGLRQVKDGGSQSQRTIGLIFANEASFSDPSSTGTPGSLEIVDKLRKLLFTRYFQICKVPYSKN
jgi:hypothetical protein